MFFKTNLTSPLSTERSDLTFWCEASVRDRLWEFYVSEIGEAETASQAARLHWAAWRGLLAGFPMVAVQARRDLENLCAGLNIRGDLIEQGDELVVDEIAEMIFNRFRRSPVLAKNYTKCLVAAAMILGETHRDKAPAAPLRRSA